MKTIIITVLLSILGFYSLYRMTKEDNDFKFGAFAIICMLSFMFALLCPLITKNRYVYNVTVIAQNGQEYNYEECYIEQERTKVTVRIKNKEPIIFYTPIKVDQERMEEDAD
jgi:Na+/melibiose symporter-like transporter